MIWAGPLRKLQRKVVADVRREFVLRIRLVSLAADGFRGLLDTLSGVPHDANLHLGAT